MHRARDTLSKLRHIAVANDAFFVWHRGPFVTINSCRLGRLPGQHVDWPEINAALGHMAMLLSLIAARAGVRFSKYVPVWQNHVVSRNATVIDRALVHVCCTGNCGAPIDVMPSLRVSRIDVLLAGTA